MPIKAAAITLLGCLAFCPGAAADTPLPARFVKFVILSEQSGGAGAAIAELEVFTLSDAEAR